MNVVTRLALVLLIASVATFAVAADPEPQAPTTPPASAERSNVPALNINQAEMEAGVVPEMVDPAKATDGSDGPSPMMTEIQAAMDMSKVEISELAERAAGTTDHAAAQAIQQEIVAKKQQTELDILAIQARYARADDNDELAQQIDAAIAAIISPPTPIAPTETRPAPGTQY